MLQKLPKGGTENVIFPLRKSRTTHSGLVSQSCTNFRDRTFSATGPRIGNYLLTNFRQPDLSYSRFRQSTVRPKRSVNPPPLPSLTVR